MNDLLTIGKAAQLTGTKAETIRYYEQIGLLSPPPRTAGNYRGYERKDIARLGFVRRARELGFPIEHIREILEIADHKERDCHRVDDLTRRHVAGIERRIADLTALKRELDGMVDSCQGGRVAECRILEALTLSSTFDSTQVR